MVVIYRNGNLTQTTSSFALASISEHALPLTSPTDCMCALCVMMPTMWPSLALEIDYNCIITPYHVEGWATALHECNLLEHYLNIVHDLFYGSPIGNPPPLTYTFIPHNMPHVSEHSAGVDALILDELKAERISGPYTFDEAHVLFRGHFRTVLLGFIERPPGCGKWRMIRNLSARDHLGVSTNDWLDAKDHSIRWHTCTVFADMVHSWSSDM